MPTPTVIHQYRYNDAINRRYWDQDYSFDNFAVNPIASKLGGGEPSGTAGDTNVLYTAFGQYEQTIIGTQTVLVPSIDDFGLNLAQSATASSGSEITMGQTALSASAFTTGQEAAFFLQAVFKIATAAGCNPLLIGFRKVQSFDASLANYTDFVSIGIVGTAGHVQLQTQLATGGLVTTDTTNVATDASIVAFRINVSSTGVVTYQYNYQPPIVVAAFTFNPGTIVIPFVRFTEGATPTTQASCNYLECGFQS